MIFIEIPPPKVALVPEKHASQMKLCFIDHMIYAYKLNLPKVPVYLIIFNRPGVAGAVL